MGLFGWVQEQAGKLVNPIHDSMKRLSSTTLYVYNTLNEPIYVLVQPNHDWTLPDAIGGFLKGIGPVGFVLGQYKMWTGSNLRDQQMAFHMFALAESPEYRAKFKAELEKDLKRFQKIEPGQLVTVQEKATFWFNTTSVSGAAGQASTIFKNEWVGIINESMTKAAAFCSNEDESWIFRENDVVRSQKKDRRAAQSDGASFKVYNV